MVWWNGRDFNDSCAAAESACNSTVADRRAEATMGAGRVKEEYGSGCVVVVTICLCLFYVPVVKKYPLSMSNDSERV